MEEEAGKASGYKSLMAQNSRIRGCRLKIISMGGNCICLFLGCNSNGKSSPALAVQEALVEALLQAKELGFLHIVVLTGKQKSRENMQ